MSKLFSIVFFLYACYATSPFKEEQPKRPPKVHRNILINGKNNLFDNVDFNAKYGIAPGDTVVLSGDYGAIRFKKIDSVYFKGEGLVNATTIKFYSGAMGKSCSVVGDPRYKYGIRIAGTQFGLEYYITGTAKLRGISTSGNPTGFKIVHDTLVRQPYDFLNLDMTNCSAEGGSLEAYYIGAATSVGAQINLRMDSCVARKMGWDGIQVRVGKFDITNCTVDSVGLLKVVDQNHGILVGGNSRGSVISHCSVTNVDGYALFINGFGPQVVECNYFDGAMMVQSLEGRTDFQKMGSKSFVVRNNTVNARNGIALYAYFNKTKGVPMSLTYTDNKTKGTAAIQPGITVLKNENNSFTAKGICSDLTKVPIKTIRVYTDGSVEAN